MPSKFITDTEGLDYTLGQTERKDGDGGYERPDKVTAKVRRIITCPDLGRIAEWEQSLGSASEGSGKTNDVLTKYKQGPQNRAPRDEWERHWSEQNKKINSNVPSVRVGNFSCDYELVVS